MHLVTCTNLAFLLALNFQVKPSKLLVTQKAKVLLFEFNFCMAFFIFNALSRLDRQHKKSVSQSILSHSIVIFIESEFSP